MAEETQYTAVTGQTGVSTANTNLDGTGTLGSLITAASNGTFIKTVTFTARGNTTEGMLRLFIYDGSNNTRLIAEIEVDAVTRSSRDKGFSVVVPLGLNLKSGYILKASTQNAEFFAVTTEALNWAYYATSVRTDTTQYTANTGMVTISTANSNTDGTGTLGTAFTAGAAASYKGCRLDSITVKATGNTTPGVVRIFIVNDLVTKFALLKEVIVPYVNPKSSLESFSETIRFEDGFDIQAGYKVCASTENAESFVVTVEARDWCYLA